MAERAREEGARESGWSLRVGSPLGIPVRLHFTFLLLLLWFGFLAYERGGNPFRGMLYVLLLFACVVLHELGHAAMALRFGVRTRQIVLYPIGGVASLERIPGGKAELLIALAGPAVNLAIAGVLLVATVLLGVPALARPEAMVPGRDLLPSLLATNVMLFLFNLIPAFPMDGGRVLRAFLAARMHPNRATILAARIGMVGAVAFAVWALTRERFQGGILLAISISNFLSCMAEVRTARFTPGPYFQGDTVEPWQTDPDAWKRGDAPDAAGDRRPGPIARWRARRREAAEQRRREERAALEASLDRILAKVSEVGLAGLTPAERETLKRASELRRS
jgi:Zn-dependent protease